MILCQKTSLNKSVSGGRENKTLRKVDSFYCIMNDDKKIIPQEVSALANKVKYDIIEYKGTLDGKVTTRESIKKLLSFVKKQVILVLWVTQC